MEYVYSRHASRLEAEEALISYFAEAIVSEGEKPVVRRLAGAYRGKAWAVLFNDGYEPAR